MVFEQTPIYIYRLTIQDEAVDACLYTLIGQVDLLQNPPASMVVEEVHVNCKRTFRFSFNAYRQGKKSSIMLTVSGSVH